MKRRFILWPLDSPACIIVVREGEAACEELIRSIVTGEGVIQYDDHNQAKYGVSSFLVARHVKLFHVEVLD